MTQEKIFNRRICVCALPDTNSFYAESSEEMEKDMAEKWVEVRKGGNYEEIGQRLSVSPVTARLMRNRGLSAEEEMRAYLKGDLSMLYAPDLLKDARKTAELLLNKIKEGAKIRVIGDYDIDGVCSAYILKTALQNCGANADCALPHRIRDGYGLNRNLIDDAVESGVDTIVTCDNGIAAREEIAYGKSLGMTILVTDHHEAPFTEEKGEKVYQLPEADALVNPKQPGCPYPYKELCGAGVAYKLSQLLYEIAGTGDSGEFLEFVAFATIGDVMPLTGENRILVKYGLRKLKETKNKGMQALIKECGLSEKSELTPYHVGFVLGPCMNATGRLDTAENALKLLGVDTKEEAERFAKDLKQMNDVRKDLTETYLDEAVSLVESGACKGDKVLVAYLPECHESIAGIIAGRMRERYFKPSFVLTDTEEGVKGSGRSIDAYNMYEEMTKCQELFTKYGGHRQAAGFSMLRKNVEELRRMLNENTCLTEEDLCEKVSIDLVLPFSAVSEELIGELKMLEPCGMGNRKPVFAARNVELNGARIFGKNHNVLKCLAKDESGVNLDAVYFGDAQSLMQEIQERRKMHLVYYPEINEYNGMRAVQIVIQKYR